MAYRRMDVCFFFFTLPLFVFRVICTFIRLLVRSIYVCIDPPKYNFQEYLIMYIVAQTEHKRRQKDTTRRHAAVLLSPYVIRLRCAVHNDIPTSPCTKPTFLWRGAQIDTLIHRGQTTDVIL